MCLWWVSRFWRLPGSPWPLVEVLSENETFSRVLKSLQVCFQISPFWFPSLCSATKKVRLIFRNFNMVWWGKLRFCRVNCMHKELEKRGSPEWWKGVVGIAGLNALSHHAKEGKNGWAGRLGACTTKSQSVDSDFSLGTQLVIEPDYERKWLP